MKKCESYEFIPDYFKNFILNTLEEIHKDARSKPKHLKERLCLQMFNCALDYVKREQIIKTNEVLDNLESKLKARGLKLAMIAVLLEIRENTNEGFFNCLMEVIDEVRFFSQPDPVTQNIVIKSFEEAYTRV